eukprot:01278.XXX_1274_1853_1 [CDS] Oithona nana genome sequencing.
MLERPQLERRKKCKPREQLTGKRKQARPLAKDSSPAKWIRVTTPQLNYYHDSSGVNKHFVSFQ